jgi:hypothetical protein
MANESVTATTTSPISIDVIDATSFRLSNALAITDLLMECNPQRLGKGTLAGAAYVLMELLGETKDLITGKMEAQS